MGGGGGSAFLPKRCYLYVLLLPFHITVTNWGAEMNPRSLKEHLTCEVHGYFKKQHFLQDGFTIPARK